MGGGQVEFFKRISEVKLSNLEMDAEEEEEKKREIFNQSEIALNEENDETLPLAGIGSK